MANNPEPPSEEQSALIAEPISAGVPSVGTAEVAKLSLRPPHMTVIVPPNEPHVLVTADQIDQLCKHGEDQSFNWFLALLALAAGFSQNLYALVVDLSSSTLPEAWDVITALVCVGCATGAMAKYTQHRGNKANLENYVTKLKSGPQVNVT